MFWHARGHVTEAARWIEAAFGAANGAAPPLARAKALYTLASLADLTSDHARAEVLLGESLEILEQLPESPELSYALCVKSEVVLAQGDLRGARECADEAVRVARRVDDWYRTMVSLDRLAYVVSVQGHQAEARRLMDEALRVAREAGQPRPVARCLVSLGWFVLLEGAPTEAQRLCEEGLDLIRDTDDPKVASELLHTLGVARLEAGDRRAASDDLCEALELAYGLGITPYVRGCIDGLAAVSGADGDPQRCAFLRGVADRLCESSAETRTEQETALYGRHVSLARRSLSEAQWSALLDQGRTAPLWEAIELALSS